MYHYVIVSKITVIRNTAIATKNTFYTGLAVLKKKVNMLMLIMCVNPVSIPNDS